MGELPEVIRVDDQPLAHALLKSRIEIVPVAGPDGIVDRAKHIFFQTARARGARQQQVFVKRRLKSARIGGSQHGVGGQQIGEPQTGLNSVGRYQPVILVVSQPGVDGELAQRNGVLNVERVLVDVVRGVKIEGTPPRVKS